MRGCSSADALTTNLAVPGVIFRQATDVDKQRIFDNRVDSVGDWLLECGETIVATGGFLTHYNPPYADIYMKVDAAHRRRGYGSYFVQELKRVCYETGHIPAARCDVSNTGSRSTLEKAGLLPCARVLMGRLDRGLKKWTFSRRLRMMPEFKNRVRMLNADHPHRFNRPRSVLDPLLTRTMPASSSTSHAPAICRSTAGRFIHFFTPSYGSKSFTACS